jgi:hypothetical protein
VISTAREIARWARHDRYARWALAVVWLGVLIGTSGIAQLHLHLRRHPLNSLPDRDLTPISGPAVATTGPAGHTTAAEVLTYPSADGAAGSAAPVPAASPVGAAGITPRLVTR